MVVGGSGSALCANSGQTSSHGMWVGVVLGEGPVLVPASAHRATFRRGSDEIVTGSR